jgi:hypothetical protein
MRILKNEILTLEIYEECDGVDIASMVEINKVKYFKYFHKEHNFQSFYILSEYSDSRFFGFFNNEETLYEALAKSSFNSYWLISSHSHFDKIPMDVSKELSKDEYDNYIEDYL